MYTVSVASIAPINAPTTVTLSPKIDNENPVTITVVAPKAAPEETPSTYGSAIGFLKIPWKTAPHIESAPPIRHASIILGSLILLTIIILELSIPDISIVLPTIGNLEKIILNPLVNGIFAEPIVAEIIIIKTSATAAMITLVMNFLFDANVSPLLSHLCPFKKLHALNHIGIEYIAD